MKKLLLLHNRHTPDDSDIWRVAIKRGWSTARTNKLQVKEHMEGFDLIRYYGNTLHATMIEDQLPFQFLEINPKHLTTLSETKRIIRLNWWRDVKEGITVPGRCFFKPVSEKWFEARVYEKDEVITAHGIINGDAFYASNPVNFIDEVRCFVLNGHVLTSSLYRINKVNYQEVNPESFEINFDQKIKDTPIQEYVTSIFQKVDLPAGLVMDFGLMDNGEWSLIEFNEAWASGLYYCDPEKCFDVIVESQK